jgi:hypothetical protein
MTCSNKALATRLMFALGGHGKDDIEGAETAYRETRRLGRRAAAGFNVLIQALGQLTPMSTIFCASPQSGPS